MENEEISCSGSSFTTASPCSATVLSFGYAESDCDFSDSEVDSVVSESSCATAVPELEFVDSLVLLRSRCASASLLPPAEESEVVITFDSDSSVSEDLTQNISEVVSLYELPELNNQVDWTLSEKTRFNLTQLETTLE